MSLTDIFTGVNVNIPLFIFENLPERKYKAFQSQKREINKSHTIQVNLKTIYLKEKKKQLNNQYLLSGYYIIFTEWSTS